jgi:PhnB protein
MVAPRRTPPPPYRTVTPRMFVSDVEKAVAFLRVVFDATADIEPGRPTDVHIGDSVVLVGSAAERESVPACLYIYVNDADATHRRAMDAGAANLEEPMDTPYGDRRGMFRDAFGNIYQVAHRL